MALQISLHDLDAWLMPSLLVAAGTGARYLIMAVAASLFAMPTQEGRWGRAHDNAPVRFDARRNIRRELSHSSVTLLVVGLSHAILYGTGIFQSSRIYFDMADYPIWWLLISIPVILILHDALFYWMHRGLHSKQLFRRVHLVHHQSIHPTAFAAYSFHPTEAIGHLLISVPILFVIPAHPIAILVAGSLATAANVYGHCGREFFPVSMATSRFGKWINTSTAHAKHHAGGRYNFGLYFLYWDRLMGTIEPRECRDSPATP